MSGLTVRAYDPHAHEKAEPLLPGVARCGSALEAAEKADVTVIVTEWNEFRALNLDRLKASMRGDVLVDLRNVYLPAQARAAGFTYAGIGVIRGQDQAKRASQRAPLEQVAIVERRVHGADVGCINVLNR